MSLRPRRWFPLAVAFIALIFFVDHALISRAAPTQQVWINEVMARPNTGGKEWVELFNPNPIAVDLTGWNKAASDCRRLPPIERFLMRNLNSRSRHKRTARD